MHQTSRMERRTVLRLLGGAVGSALLWGCGSGGSSTPKRIVRGIVVEEDGSGNITPAGAGKMIAAITTDGAGNFVTRATASTDAQGKFALSLPGGTYELPTNAYHTYGSPMPQDFYSSCATVPFVVHDGNKPLAVQSLADGSGSGSAVPQSFATQADQLLSQYQASGIYGSLDVVILADLPCVGQSIIPAQKMSRVPARLSRREDTNDLPKRKKRQV